MLTIQKKHTSIFNMLIFTVRTLISSFNINMAYILLMLLINAKTITLKKQY